jgi:hypothetical protein
MAEKNSNNQLVHSDDYMQMMPIAQAQAWYNDFAAFTKSILKPELDYGTIPGTPKPTLYKAGAEKLRFVYGLGVEFEPIERTVDLKTPFVDYTYRCIIKSKQGQILSQCEGNCNSLETKFGYVWLTMNEIPDGTDVSKLKSKTSGRKLLEFEFAIEKKETGGQYGKPAEYWQKWQDAIDKEIAKPVWKKSRAGKDLRAFELDETVTLYRVLNPDVVGLKNTIMKMAQKRAFVGAILIATGASEYFTQDIEDMEINGQIYSVDHPEKTEEAEFTEVKTEVKKQKLSDKAFADALKRIDDGEKELIGKLAGTYTLSSEQQSLLEERMNLFVEP